MPASTENPLKFTGITQWPVNLNPARARGRHPPYRDEITKFDLIIRSARLRGNPRGMINPEPIAVTPQLPLSRRTWVIAHYVAALRAMPRRLSNVAAVPRTRRLSIVGGSRGAVAARMIRPRGVLPDDNLRISARPFVRSAA